MPARKRVLWLGLVLALVAPAACGGASASRRGSGQPLVLTVDVIDALPVDLTAWRGGVAIVHVFATWSAASQGDHDLLASVVRDQRAKVLAIGVDQDGARLLRPYRDVLNPPFPIGVAPDGLVTGSTPLGPVPVVPTTIVLDSAGREVVRLEGGLSTATLDAALDRAGAPGRRGPR